ncbi:MAG TPA: sigma-70 family RNA polymerase sigma factor [Solirubrobacteraceae bacterium]|jgi:RNA polymerase sigma factor (sigma-70 family)|nr:sigma-70 family RNA polymerase sigma factor [Solirubrobacteraceae bacterium]
MTTKHADATTSDPIAAHRYVRPTVREISPVAAAPPNTALTSRTLPAGRRAAVVQRQPRAGAGELEHLVAAAAAGDRAAMSELMQQFTPRVRAVARAHRLADHDVEDVMQTTWLRLLQHVDTIRNPDVVGAWLDTTARRESRRVLKANSRERPTDNEVFFDAPVPPVDEQLLPTPERCAAALAVALRQLSRDQRELVSMLFSDPIPSYAEISAATGMPIGSIGPTRVRSLARLRRHESLRDLADECLLAIP